MRMAASSLFHPILIFSIFIIKSGKCDVNSPQYSHDASRRMKEIYPELYSNMFEGDIYLGWKETKNAIYNPIYMWPHKTIPYTVDKTFSDEERDKISSAMKTLESGTCIKFLPHSKEKHFLWIRREAQMGCFASVGYHAEFDFPHPMNLQSPECLNHRGTIEHELLHVIGLFHEQSRADRDNHVDIYWQNIDEKYWNDFKKVNNIEANDMNIAYDLLSVMHYPRRAFSKNGNDTIVSKKDPKMPIGQRVGATPADMEKVRKAYRCPKGNATEYSTDWLFSEIQNFFNSQMKFV